MNELMKKILAGFLFIICFYLCGPRKIFHEKPVNIKIPQDVESYVDQDNKNSPPIMKDCEKKIFWAYPDKRKTKYSIIFARSSIYKNCLKGLPVPNTLKISLFFLLK